MSGHRTQDAVKLRDCACTGVRHAVVRPRQAWPSLKYELALGGPAWREEVQGGFRTADPWARLIDLVAGTRR
jgi:hypothetical protein